MDPTMKIVVGSTILTCYEVYFPNYLNYPMIQQILKGLQPINYRLDRDL